MTIEKSKSIMKFAAILSRAYCVILGAITVVGLRFMIYDPTNVPDFMTGAALKGEGLIGRDMASGIGKEFIANCFVIAVLWIVSNVLMHIVRGNAPFSIVQTKRVRLAVGLMLASMLVSPIVGGCLGKAIQQTNEMGVHITLQLQDVVFVVLLFCLATFFDYGRRLQEQADSTV